MPAYLLAFHGGRAMPEADDDNLTSDAWYDWMSGIAEQLIDAGNPTRGSRLVAADGTVTEPGDTRVSGYTIVAAMTMEEAIEIARTCPILAEGGSVEVSELVEFEDDEEDENEDDEDEDEDDEARGDAR